MERIRRYNSALRNLAENGKLPMIDLFAEMEARNDTPLTYLRDGVHPNGPHAGGPATASHLAEDGSLLKCYLHVYKGMEVKRTVLDQVNN